jgi:hypothetical protein
MKKGLRAMSLHAKALAGAALIAALGIGFAQSVHASPTLQQEADLLMSQAPVEGEVPVQQTGGVTRVPARVIRVFGNDYAQVEILSTGETRPIEFRYLGDTRRIVPGTFLIVDYEADEVVATEIVTEDEANALLTEIQTAETETQVQQTTPAAPPPTTQQQPAPAAPPATTPPATQQQPAPAPPALW